jgi:hypothetical protein
MPRVTIKIPPYAHTLRHLLPMQVCLTDHDGSPEHPPLEVTKVCETHYPYSVCSCGEYYVDWEW